MNSEFTGERLLTSVYNDNTVKHLHRYALTLNLIKDKTILDIASGEGYGSYLMSNEAKYVYGVDIDSKTIAKAKQKYKEKNLQFIEGSTSLIPLGDNSVDVVVSFETLEHHGEHEQMMKEIKRVLTPDGVLLISTPDKHFYSDIRNYKNEFHVKELYKPEFIDLVSKNFNNYQLLSQSYISGNSIIVEDSKRDSLDFYSGSFLKLEYTFSSPQYLIAQCSNSELQILNDSIFDGKQLIDSKVLEIHLKAVYDSNSYKLGNIILSPLIALRNFFRFKDTKEQ